MIHLITGGTRSGKSTYAQNSALNLSENPIFISTSRILDEEFEERIAQNKKDRDKRFVSVEKDRCISEVYISDKVVVVDSVTLWIMNIFMDLDQDIAKTLLFIKSEVEAIERANAQIFLITNEMGMGANGESKFARKFIDLQGWVNQYLAKKAVSVTMMVSGIPLKVK